MVSVSFFQHCHAVQFRCYCLTLVELFVDAIVGVARVLY